MSYRSELAFLQSILKRMHLRCLVMRPDDLEDPRIDMGLRRFAAQEEEYLRGLREFAESLRPNTLYLVRDTLHCSHFILMLPGVAETAYLSVGPYLSYEVTRERLMAEAERFGVPPSLFPRMERFYGGLPVIREPQMMMALMLTFADSIWGGEENYTMEVLERDVASQLMPMEGETAPQSPEVTLMDMEMLERRYGWERDMMERITRGQAWVVTEQLRGNVFEMAMERRSADPLRNTKNYGIILNTLARKAAEQGGVHPVYLDRTSSNIARRLENARDLQEASGLLAEIPGTYARLVKKHSGQGYPAPVQKLMACVEADLTADLSLSALAQVQGLNPSYLSTLFKKETGETVTGYVCRRRMETAARLLRTTTLQVQTIARYCGVADVNYFTKLFKRQFQKTPNEYRRGAL